MSENRFGEALRFFRSEMYAAYRERVGMLLPRFARKDALQITTAFLSIYAGLLVVQHGVFEMLQGSRDPGGMMISAIGPPCQPEAVWHACFPAMSLIPNLFLTGMVAILFGMGMVVWAVVLAGHRRGGLALGILSLLALLVGGGFVPVWIGLVAAIANLGLHRPFSRPRFSSLALIWPWPLIVMALWLPGSWLLGTYFGGAMLSASGLLFFIFDITLPGLAAISAYLARRDLMTIDLKKLAKRGL